MTIWLMDAQGFDFSPIFEFDAELEEEKTSSYAWTQYPIELGAEVSDFGSKLPKRYRVSGIVTASPLEGIPSPLRPGAIEDALTSFADTCQPMTLVTGHWVADVVIDEVVAGQTTETGEALEISISCHTIQLPQSIAVLIPPALLVAGGAPDTGPTEAAGVTPTGADAAAGKSGLASLVDSGNPFDAGAAALDTFGF